MGLHRPLQDEDVSEEGVRGSEEPVDCPASAHREAGEGDEPRLLGGITEDITKMVIAPAAEDAAAGASPLLELEKSPDDTPLSGGRLMADPVPDVNPPLPQSPLDPPHWS
jgi:hypothetical protein